MSIPYNSEEAKCVIAVGPSNSSLVLFAHGAIIECELSEISAIPCDLGIEVEEGLGYGIWIWEGTTTYVEDEDGGETTYYDQKMRAPNEEELKAILNNISPWPKLWNTEIEL